MGRSCRAQTKFVFVSQSCLPIKPFAHVRAALLSDDCCHFSAMDEEPISKGSVSEAAIDGRHVSKASQWCVLNRSLAAWCVHAPPEYVGGFSRMHGAPDEWFFLSTARHIGMPPWMLRVSADDAHDCHTGPTHVNWSLYPAAGQAAAASRQPPRGTAPASDPAHAAKIVADEHLRNGTKHGGIEGDGGGDQRST